MIEPVDHSDAIRRGAPTGPLMSNGEWSPCYSVSPTGRAWNRSGWTLGHLCGTSRECPGRGASLPCLSEGGPVQWRFPRPRLHVLPPSPPYASTVGIVA